MYHMLYYQPGEHRDAGLSEVRAIGPNRGINTRIHELWSNSDAGDPQYAVWVFTALAKKLSCALCDVPHGQ